MRASTSLSVRLCSASADPLAHLPHLVFLHAAGGERRRSDADAAGLQRRIGIERNRVLVHGDAGLVQRVLGFAAQHALGEDIHQHQVGVRAAGDDAEALVGQGLGQHGLALATICFA